MKLRNIATVSAWFAGSLSIVSVDASATTYYYNASSITANGQTSGGYNGYTLYSVTPGTSFYISTTSVSGVQPQLQFYDASNNTIAINTNSTYSLVTTATQVTAASNLIAAFSFLGAPGPTTTTTGLCISSTGTCTGGGGGGGGGSSSSSINLSPNAYALRSVYNIQSVALNAGLSYDCTVFDKEGMCLSTGGRYSTTNLPETNTTSGLLIGSYKYDKNIRLGAWVDQNLATSNTTGIKLSNSEPLFGVFGAWSERNDGLGYEVKVSAGYGDKDVAISRTSSLEGASKLSSRGIQTVSSYGMAIDKDWIAAPYVGVKYISIKRGAYSEAGGLTYNNLRQETTSAVAGVKLTGKIDAQTFTVLSAGIEQDLNHNEGQYSATSGDTTTFNSNPQKTRPVVTAGVYYDIDKTQRVGLNAIHRQEAFQSTATTSALATYTVGF